MAKLITAAGGRVNANVLVPKVPALDVKAVGEKLAEFGERADKALAASLRVEIDSEEKAAKVTDFVAALTKTLAEVDDYRKATTGQFDKLVKGLNGLFNLGPKAKLEQAKTAAQAKLGKYVRDQRAKAEEEARAAAERAAAEAAAQAAQAVKEGDAEGAMQILQEAASVVVEAPRVEVRGNAAVLATTRRKVGRITDLRAFLAWAATSPSPQALAICGGITVGQREQNQLAARVLDIQENPLAGTPPSIPGFVAEYEETFGAR